VIRYNGGNNAGHTVVSERGTLRLHQVPSGICYADVDCVIGPGVVVNPAALFEELDMLEAAGISTARLRISDRAHLVFPFHVEVRSEEHTSELQSRVDLVCRLLLEKKNHLH